MNKVIPVILCGGFGKRLWPLSNLNKPKQFLKIPSNSKMTLFQNTILRFKAKKFTKPIIICSEVHKFLVSEQLSQINVKPLEIIIEPTSKNTSASVCLSLIIAKEKFNAQNLLISSSDHLIDGINFDSLLPEHLLSPINYHLIFGIKPNSPDTNFGYIETIFNKNKSFFNVKNFHEKPNLIRARKYFKQKNFYWNSGIFFLNASFTLNEFKKFNYKVYYHTKKSIEKSGYDLTYLKIDKNQFSKLPNSQFDKSILEKSDDIKMLELKNKWVDIGNWKNFFQLENSVLKKEENKIENNVINSEVYSNSKFTILNDIQDLIVINKNNSLLISSKTNIDDVNRLLSNNDHFLNNSQEFYRPWGKYIVLEKKKNFLIKKITLKSHHKISLQKHKFRSEHWIVLNGKAKVTRDDDIYYLKKNESTFIPQNIIHCLENEEKIDLEIIEIQMGTKLSEKDIIRIEDPYGRIK